MGPKEDYKIIFSIIFFALKQTFFFLNSTDIMSFTKKVWLNFLRSEAVT